MLSESVEAAFTEKVQLNINVKIAISFFYRLESSSLSLGFVFFFASMFCFFGWFSSDVVFDVMRVMMVEVMMVVSQVR